MNSYTIKNTKSIQSSFLTDNYSSKNAERSNDIPKFSSAINTKSHFNSDTVSLSKRYSQKFTNAQNSLSEHENYHQKKAEFDHISSYDFGNSSFTPNVYEFSTEEHPSKRKKNFKSLNITKKSEKTVNADSLTHEKHSNNIEDSINLVTHKNNKYKGFNINTNKIGVDSCQKTNMSLNSVELNSSFTGNYEIMSDISSFFSPTDKPFLYENNSCYKTHISQHNKNENFTKTPTDSIIINIDSSESEIDDVAITKIKTKAGYKNTINSPTFNTSTHFTEVANYPPIKSEFLENFTESNTTSAYSKNANKNVIVSIIDGNGTASEVGICTLNLETKECILSQYADYSGFSKTLYNIELYNASKLIISSGNTSGNKSKLYERLSSKVQNTDIVFVPRSFFNEEKGKDY
ncbi:MutS protein-like protein [Smittium culicis]|uniref:MutS protein-like protein n=1 Tax=Smittium culicis TaxID=133412 RepID=A0A1R1YFJ2_9FUNG|nr:MutS protein-like protein [Smittium culicis]